MNLKEAINSFYYRMTLFELRRMNQGRVFPQLSYNSLLYLDLIEMTPDCTPSRLAELLHVSKSAVAIKVGELIRLGLVRKRPCEKDKRVVFLDVDPGAIEEYRTFDKPLHRALNTVGSRYSPEEITTFCTVLDTFIQGYTEEV